MDEETQPKRGSNLGKILWALVLVALVLLWWHFRGKSDAGNTPEEQQADRMAAIDTDPDDILVDVKDDATPDQIAALEREAGIQLTLVDDTAKDSQLYRAHVEASRRDAIID